MPQLAVAVVGSELATAFAGAELATGALAFGMTAGQIGFAAGSLVGGLLFSPTQKSQGPRLADLKAANVTAGSVLAYIEGHPPIGGFIAWASEKHELSNTTDAGGKGGGGSEQTTYTYTQDLLYVLSENMCWGALRRVWANGQLIWTRADDSTSASVQNDPDHWTRITFYDGNAAQLPDPTYEAAVGTANAPAYRTRCSVFIEGLKLGTSGQLPNLIFEGVPASSGSTYSAVRVLSNFAATDYTFPVPRGAAMVDTRIRVWGIRSGSVVAYSADAATYVVGSSTTDAIPTDAAAVSPGQGSGDQPLAVFGGTVGHFYVAGDGISHDYTITGTPDIGSDGIRWACWNAKIAVGTHDGASDIYLHNLSGSSIGTATHGHVIDSLALTASTIYALSGSTVYPYDAVSFAAGSTFAVPSGSGHRIFASAEGDLCCATASGEIFKLVTGAWASLGTMTAGVDLGTASCIHMVAGNDLYAVRNLGDGSAVLQSVDMDWHRHNYDGGVTGVLNTLVIAPPTFAVLWGDVKGYVVSGLWDDRGYVEGNQLRVTPTYVPGHITTYSPGSPTLLQLGLGNITVGTINEIPPGCATDGVLRWTGLGYTQSHQDVYKSVSSNVYALVEPTLADVVLRQCERGGLTADDVDVSALTTRTVRGMAITQISSPRSVIEMLMQAYAFTAVEGDKIYFRWRGSDPVATITFAELVDNGSDPLPMVRLNDIELPVQIFVKYSNVDDDYQDGNESSDRLVSSGTNTTSVEFPLVGTPTEAKRVADFLVTDAVSSLMTFGPFSTTRDYAALEPSDVINLVAQDGTSFRVRLTKKTEAAGVLTFEGVSDLASAPVSRAVTTTSGYTNSTAVQLQVDTELLLLDIPILSDSDDDAGFYAFVKAATDVTFPGAVLFTSVDDVTYSTVGSTTQEATFGTATSVLGSGAVGVFDERNTVTVNVGFGVLYSYTRDNILNGVAPLYAVGAELLYARTATMVSAGVYTLSGLLRGRRGTEGAVGTHGASETFAVLDSAARRVPLDNASVGVARYWKAVTMGRTGDTATGATFTDNAVGKKPFAPCDLRVTRDASNNITITLQRRTRASTRLIGALGVSCPLDEDFEKYEIDVYATSGYATVKRTLSASSPSFSYTAAQQTTDFGSAQATVYVKAYQLSATVGRGYALTTQG